MPPPPLPLRHVENRVRVLRVMAVNPARFPDPGGDAWTAGRVAGPGIFERQRRVLPDYFPDISNGSAAKHRFDDGYPSEASTPSTPRTAVAPRRVYPTPVEGLKKAFRGDGSGSMVSPHTPVQVASIFVAELLGTALLLFIGCLGTMLPLGKYEHENSFLQANLVFGVAVMVIIQIIGRTSMAHINPAVTVCSLILGKIRIITFAAYVLAQLLGSIIGVGLLKAVTPSGAWNASAGAGGCCVSCLTVPHGSLSDVQALLVEFMGTVVLVFLVCSVWDPRADADNAAAIKFGLTIIGLGLAAGNMTGASWNPARSFGPALWEGVWERQWVYWVGPVSGSAFATLFYSYVLAFDYPAKPTAEEVGLTAIKDDGQRAGRLADEPDH